MQRQNRVIITGAPGTGKTAILTVLNERGYHAFEERARYTIKEQLELAESTLLPWKDIRAFSQLVQERQLADYQSHNGEDLHFYDRGLPDVLAYLHRVNIYDYEMEERARTYLYHPKVFLTPPWPEIYATDNERREDMDEMLGIHNALVNTYEAIGYELIEVPKLSAQKRAEFVLEQLKT